MTPRESQPLTEQPLQDGIYWVYHFSSCVADKEEEN